MSRYFSVKRPKARTWDEDEDAWGWTSPVGVPSVCEHEAVDTGLLDADGDTIMRSPNPMGFVWDDD